jgi:REP element-mobilizing transposase RayT
MPRAARSNIKTSFYHIMTQGINREKIFNNDNYTKMYIGLMKKLAKQKNIEIISYCVMGNHTHILIKTECVCDMAKYMHKLNFMYATYYNKKNKRVGYVFRDRYKCEGVYSEEYLKNCIIYIHNNPVKAKICLEPILYNFSSYKEFLRSEYFKRIFDGNIENYKNAHNLMENENFLEEENNIGQVIDQFLIMNDINLNELKLDLVLLKQLLNELKVQKGFSYRKIEKALGICRHRIKRLVEE